MDFAQAQREINSAIVKGIEDESEHNTELLPSEKLVLFSAAQILKKIWNTNTPL